MKKSKSPSLEEALVALVEGQQRTEQRMERVEEVLVTLAEAQHRTEERLGRLEEAQLRTQEQIGQLAEAQRRTEETVRQLGQQMGKLSDAIGFGLEDIAHVVLPGYLERHLGIHVFGDELERRFLITEDGQTFELDIYGKGQHNGDTVEVVGECKSRIRSSQVEHFARTVERLRPHIEDKLIPVMFGYWIHPSALEAAQKAGIVVVASYQR